MATQFDLLKQPKFVSMFFTQFLGAFNDNVFKQALILVLTYTAAAKLGQPISLLTNLAALLFILPFFLFSALAGQLADKYEKAFLTRRLKLLEIAIMGLVAIGFWFEIYTLLFVALFLMGAQSAFFGPIKYAYLPEAMKEDELVGANGLFQMGTSVAILTGMMAAGVLTQLENSFVWTSAFMLVIALLGYVAARAIPSTHQSDLSLAVDWHIGRTSWQIIKFLRQHRLLWLIVMGNSWFWFYGATVLTQTPEFSKTILHGNESVVIFLLTLFSVGTATGSVLCKTLTKNEPSLRLLPFSIAGLTIFAVSLYWALANFSVEKSGEFYGVYELLALDGSFWVIGSLFLLGLFGGFYIVPLYAMMQAFSPVAHRARVVGANNIFNAIFMVGSAVFSMAVLIGLGRSIGDLLVLTGVINAGFGIYLYRQLTLNLPK